MEHKAKIISVFIGVVAVAAVVVMVIMPSIKKGLDLDSRISQAELMEKLGPYSKALSLSLDQTDKDLPDYIQNKPIPAAQVGGVTETFRGLALKNGLKAEQIEPDLKELDFSSPQKDELVLTVHLTLGGRLANMQSFLVDCAKLPFFKSLNNMKVKRDQETLKMELTMKLAVSRKKGRA